MTEAPSSAVATATSTPAGPFPRWYRSLPREHRPVFWAGFAGWGLDAFDFTTLPLALGSIAAAFTLNSTQSGLIMTVTLLASAVGGALAGLLSDRVGRVRVLMITIATFAVFTALSGLSQNYGQMLLFKGLQGLGFGGEFAAGAVLIAEVAPARHRGRIMGFVHSSYAVGWGLAVLAYTVIFSHAGPDAWRYLFLLGILPALALLFIRRNVRDSVVSTENRRRIAGETPAPVWGGLVALFGRDLRHTTLFALLVGIGVQGGYFAIFTWLPSYLHTERGLTVVGTSGYLSAVIAGCFLGYVGAGFLHDWVGRRATFIFFAVSGVVCVVAYTWIPEGANGLLLVLGVPLGMAACGSLAGTGVFFSELFPSRVRGTGVGVVHNFGRGVAAFFPSLVGALSSVFGLKAAMGVGALGYVLVIVGVVALPETRGRQIA
ncbi:MFS transporter [Streptomyces sp. NBC_01462]|uniref:MFS transporter n=1 Tax=Streptomyces sp. NBC_01462 TaxID=2903876 RepID=UPI00143EB892|nr:MFS transporter [Streptomyces sp. NBC_01462]QIY66174.1 MFS transporter [Streptomyces sp. RPA4-2]